MLSPFAPRRPTARSGGALLALALALVLGAPARAAGPAFLVNNINLAPSPQASSGPSSPILIGDTLISSPAIQATDMNYGEAMARQRAPR